MKFPRGVSGERLVRVLKSLGYEEVRQRGSHLRLQHVGPPRHSVSVPMHDQLRTGTLHAILSDVARMRSISIETLIGQL